MFHHVDILDRLLQGEKQRNIQAALGVSPKEITAVRTVAALEGWLEPGATLPSKATIHAAVEQHKQHRRAQRRVAEGKPEQETPQASQVEPYRELVAQWVKSGEEAKAIWQGLIRNHGFKGSYSSVRRFVRRIAADSPDPIVRMQFAPGEQAQVDFGSGPQLLDPATGKTRRTHIFVMTLSYSRHQYAEIVWDQSVSTWLRCHRNAFNFFGGVPRTARIDNLKSAITKACRYDSQVQRSYGEFAKAVGFTIDPCIVRTPEHKGRVESGVKYVKKSFANGTRVFRTIADANEQLMDWILGEAGNRIHGTTQQMPLRLFAEEEKGALQPLPSEGMEIAVWTTAKLHPDCHIVLEKAYYSAPWGHIGQSLDVRATDSFVLIFHEDQAVASHPRAMPGQWRTDMNHYPPEKVAFLQQTPTWCVDQAKAVGKACHDFICELFGDRVVDRLRAAQAILRLRKKYGSQRLEAACQRALAYDTIQYRTVATILEKGLDQAPIEQGEGGQLEFPFLESPRFARNIGELFPRS